VIGQHDGAIFYTIGQRHGLNVGGGLPYYVVAKDMPSNTITVTTDLADKNIWHKTLQLTDVHWINGAPDLSKKYQVRTRYRAPLISCHLRQDGTKWLVDLDDEARAITAGQSAVVYDGEVVLGGGVIV
jgi:tRNA-specific 2-thiouridylase